MDLYLSRGMDQHLLKLAFSLRPDMTPRTLAEMSLGGGGHFCSLCFFVHRSVTVRFGVFTRILWFFSKTALARAEFCPLMTGIFNVVDPSRAITLRFTCKP